MKGEEKRRIICLICPLGCETAVTIKNGRVVNVENVECQRGEEYVLREIEKPMRDFFTTVQVRGAKTSLCPVRSTQPVPKEKLLMCSRELAKMVVYAPIKVGDVIVKNFLDLGVDIMATRSLERDEEERKNREDINRHSGG